MGEGGRDLNEVGKIHQCTATQKTIIRRGVKTFNNEQNLMFQKGW